MIDLREIEYQLAAGLGAVAGLAYGSPVLALAAIWFPALRPWVLSPAAVGAVAGLIAARLMQ